MNMDAVRGAVSYGMTGYTAAGRKNNIWMEQKETFVRNEKVQEDFIEKISADPSKSQRSEWIVNQKAGGGNPGGWSLLADDEGVVSYNGVHFIFDPESNALCLGDMSQTDNVLSIPLSRGRTLKVNRNSIDDLSKAIGMFSPEDINRILRAISEDAQCRRKLNEIEDDKNSLGKEADAEENPEETMKETGIDGFGLNRRGMLTHITQFQIAQLTMDRRGQSVLGPTVL